jgi:hypothetical protein
MSLPLMALGHGVVEFGVNFPLSVLVCPSRASFKMGSARFTCSWRKKLGIYIMALFCDCFVLSELDEKLGISFWNPGHPFLSSPFVLFYVCTYDRFL